MAHSARRRRNNGGGCSDIIRFPDAADHGKSNPPTTPQETDYISMKTKQEITASKVAFEFWLDPEQKSSLDKLSQETGAPMAEHCRRAIRAYLEKIAAH